VGVPAPTSPLLSSAFPSTRRCLVDATTPPVAHAAGSESPHHSRRRRQPCHCGRSVHGDHLRCAPCCAAGRGPTLTIFAIGPGQALRPVHPFALEHITGHRARWTAVVGRIRPAEPGNPFRFSSVVYLFLEFIQTSKIHVKLYKHSKLQNKFCLNPCEYIYT
jgi:hypothetical protein